MIRDILLGKNCVLSDGLNLFECVIHDNCKIGYGTEIGKDVIIGKKCKIQAQCFIPTGVIIGDNVFIGPGVVFTNDKYPTVEGWNKSRLMVTIVEDDVQIGASAVILPGITLKKGCRVGAGAVVTKTVEENTTVVGNPAIIKN